MKTPIEKTVADNLTLLMKSSNAAGSDEKLARRSGVGRGTVQRARRGEVSLSIGNLERLADAFGLEPWQLLIPGLEPGNPPALRAVNSEERMLWQRLRAAYEELLKLNAGR